jgi:cytochrome c-type biogenesis protein CcmF
VALRRGLAEDVYLVLAAYEPGTQTATLQVHVNPLINWVWFGVSIMILGTIVAFLPERTFAFATSRSAAEAATSATTSLVLLLALTLHPAVAFAQQTGLVERSALERDIENEIMCTCGGCRLPVGTCGMPNCHGKSAQLDKLKGLIAEGKTREEILATFVRDFGSEDILARPQDRGFGRLAWLLPYGAALAGIAFVGLIAVRWSRRSEAEADATKAAPARRDLQDRLDDELRELD